LKKIIGLVVVIAAVIAGVIFWSSQQDQPTSTQIKSVASLGDSISQGFNTCEALTNCPANSWSTGSNPEIKSQAARLQEIAPPGVTVETFNNSVSGSKSSDLPRQVSLAIQQQADYITILSGSNDLCAPSVSEMTSTANFENNLRSSLTTLDALKPDTQVFISSLPNLENLYDSGNGNFRAQQIWKIAGVCQSLLANTGSEAQADVDRRALVYEREKEYNAAIESVCSSFANCMTDDNKVYEQNFSGSDLSEIDFFHPSVTGQEKLAEITWNTVKSKIAQ
jgi:lysophospholipase L1-like esterase